MKSARTKAVDIKPSVKRVVWERDGRRCILCNSMIAMPNAHYIPRSKGGLGIEQNVVTLCFQCHHNLDQTTQRPMLLELVKNYLKRKYSNWNEEDLIYISDYDKKIKKDMGR